MARILIGEPADEIRMLLDVHLRRLGHEPVHVDGVEGADPGGAGAAILEPAAPGLLALARALRELRPDFPLVFISTESQSPATRELAPVRHILKPFERNELVAAVAAALRVGVGSDGSHT